MESEDSRLTDSSLEHEDEDASSLERGSKADHVETKNVHKTRISDAFD